MKASFLRIGCALLLVAALTGCEQLFQQRSARRANEAEQKAGAGDTAGAIQLYEASLDDLERSADVHYKLALIYDDLNKPASVIHHFERYLTLAPSGPHAKDARNFIREAQLKLVTSFGGGATVPQREAVRLKNDNLALRKQVLELREELERVSKARVLALKNAGKTPHGGDQVKKELVPGVRTYTVVPGDTLASISRRFYKTPGRWKDIQDVNFNTLSGTATLKPGMVLMIP